MAGTVGTGVPNRSSDKERELARRSAEYDYSPFSIMRRLSDEMDRVFANTFGSPRSELEKSAWSPAVEVRERGGNLEVTAELPGLKKDDVKVECTEEGVVIEGEKRQERETNEAGYHRSERSYGHFYRMIPLPAGADPDKAKAEFRDGLLQLRIPIAENKRQRKQIPIAS
jgi:HSP20 family protein